MDATSISIPEQLLTLIERRHEYGDVYTYFFLSPDPVVYEPGGYGHVRLFDMPPDTKAVREFSFASAPHEKLIQFGIDSRSGSPYQQKLLSLKPGDQIGLFKIKRHMAWPPKENDAVIIAGGIGITPVRSFLVDAAHRNLKVAMHVIQVSSSAYLYGDEISRLSTGYQSTNREGLPGILKNTVKEHPHAVYYVVGSLQFVETIIKDLKSAEIEYIESDSFKGYVEE